MWENIKSYVLNVALKKYAPIGAMAAVAAAGTFMAAHAGMLESWGITYGNWPINFGTAPTGPCVVIELDTLSTAAIAAIVGLVTVAMRATEHHVAALPTPPAPPQEVAK